MDDDLTPNDSEALGVYEPEEPTDVKTTDREENSRVAIATAVSDDIISWFESVLRDYETVEAVYKTKNTYTIGTDPAFVAHHVICAEVDNMLTKFRARFTNPPEESLDD